MKITVFLFLVSVAGVLANKGYSQTKMLNLYMREASVKEVLRSIEEQSEFYFLYSEDLIDAERKVTINLENKKIEYVLNQLFEGTDVNYSIRDRIIVLTTPEVLNGEIQIVQQQKSVSGKVTDSSDSPLPGVSVVLKGTTTGTITDANGNYSIPNIPENTTLQFSFVGMKTQEIVVGSKTTINIVMEEETVGIEEVVAVGYGTVKKRDLIGSVSKVDGQNLTQSAPINVVSALQGRAAGVQVVSENGNLGSSATVRIRGYNSINSGLDPLWVIDGLPVFSGQVGRASNTNAISIFSTINPNDIESMEVLKDAAATAVYGSRGSNGVIIVTTKNGKKGKSSVNVDLSTGISTLPKTIESFGFANTEQFFALADEARRNSGNKADGTRILPDFNPSDNLNANFVKTLTRAEALATQTNWADLLLQTGNFKELNLSSNFWSEKASVYTSFNYRTDEGINKGSDFNRFTGRLNATLRPVNNLSIDVKFNGAYTGSNRVKQASSQPGYTEDAGGFNAVIHGALPWMPAFDPLDPSGLWNAHVNPLAATRKDLRKDYKTEYRGVLNLGIEYSIPWVKGLSIRSETGADILVDNETDWKSSYVNISGNSSAYEGSTTASRLNYNVFTKFNRQFKTIHSVNIVAGAEVQRTKYYNRNMTGQILTGDNQELGSANPTTMVSMAGYMSGERYLGSFFSRGEYKLKDKYIIGGSIRRDGSSAFASDTRWGTFAAGSAGWILSDENFFASLKKTINLLKIRGSFGQTGNEAIPNNQNITLLSDASGNRYSPPATIGAGTAYSVGNKDITWEKTNSIDVGIDYGLLNNRINGSIAYYSKKAQDMLLQVSVPQSAGINNIYSNVGDMQNSGFEFNVSSTNIQAKDFSWTTDFNISFNKNKVLKLTPEMEAAKGSTIAVGHSMGLFKMVEFVNIDQERGVPMIREIDYAQYTNTGEYVYTGRLVPATVGVSEKNTQVLYNRSSLPSYYGGFNNSLKWKNFDLNVFITFSGGHWINNSLEMRYTMMDPTFMKKADMLTKCWVPGKTDAEYALNAWGNTFPYFTAWDLNATDPNTGLKGYWVNPDIKNPVKLVSENYLTHPAYDNISTQFLQKGDYLRLKTITLGYNLPKQTLNKLKLSNLRIYVTANNLWTLTAYTGFDPESGDSEVLPALKSVMGGINVSF